MNTVNFLNPIKYFILAIASFNLLSQEVDPNFINGIPEDFKKEILKNADRDDYQEEIYISEETRIKKAEEQIDRLIKDALSLQKSLKSKSSDSFELKRFGEDIFDSFQSTFMPINEANVDGKYVLDVGDGLRIQIIGSLNLDQKLMIMRDGTVNIPEIGKITLAGLELNEATALVKRTISDSFIGNTAFLTLTDLRSIKVYIFGDVEKPGMYTINGNSNILHALSVAGGPSSNGSFREIELKRSGKLLGSIDIYNTLINGDTSNNYSLRSGDVVLVKPLGRLVSISGAISRPAIYEIKQNENLEDLIEMAGGLTGDFYETHVILSKAKNKNVAKVPLNEFKNYEISHRDSVYIPIYKRELTEIRTVKLTGAVNYPGEYNISDSETLSSLIAKAGGYKNNAYPFAGVLIRENAIEKTNDFSLKEYGNLIKFLIAGSNGTEAKAGMMTADSTTELLEEIKNYSEWDIGRFSIEFDLDKISRDSSIDTKLQDGDIINIPEFSNEVYLFGEFNAPGTRSYKAGASPSHYIDIAGGIAQNAHKDGIIVIDPDGTTRILNNKTYLGYLNGNQEIDIYPHSIIFVPRDISKLDTLTRGSYIAQIAATTMLPILTLISVNNN